MAMLVLGRVMGNGLAMPQSSMKLHTLAGDDFLIFGNHHGFRVPTKTLQNLRNVLIHVRDHDAWPPIKENR